MIESLELQNFKSHRHTEFKFDSSRLHAIVGQNGSGKTSTLQALWSLGDMFVKAGGIAFDSSWQSQITDRRRIAEAETAATAASRARATGDRLPASVVSEGTVAKQTLTTGEFWDAEGEDWVMNGEVHELKKHLSPMITSG
jgi:predicted ATP-binding protein involved in virulence